jgi:hypothetical protein
MDEPMPQASATPLPAETEDVEMRGVSESVEGETATGRKKKRGTYMRDGPTPYKLIKPVLKAIKEAKARE